MSLPKSSLPPLEKSLSLPPLPGSNVPASSPLPPLPGSSLPSLSTKTSTLPPKTSTLPPMSAVSLPPLKKSPKKLPKSKNSPPKKKLPKSKKSPPKKKSQKKQTKKTVSSKVNNEKEWRESLKKYLRDDMLARILPSPELREKMVSDQAMKIWEVAFTHESLNPNIGENYEELELYGDRVMGVNFLKYMLQKFPKITRSELSELRTNYLAKKFQSDLSQSLGMGNYVRTRFSKSVHVFEDILESFFGALDRVGDEVFKFGAGMGLAYNMVVNLFKDVEIDWTLTKGNPKTQIKEIFEGLGWTNPILKQKPPEDVVEDANGNTTVTLSINPIGMNYLRSVGIPISTPIIAMETDTTKTKASIKAYLEAVKTLNKLGINKEYVAEVKRQRDLNNPELANLFAAVRNKILQEGYTDYYLNEYHSKSKIPGRKTTKYVQLVGIDKEGRKTILAMTEEPVDDVLEGKKQVLREYSQ